MIPPLRLVFFLFFSASLQAQDNYEIQVYSAPTMDKGVTMIELHSNFTQLGESAIIKGVRPSYHALHETLEITHGFSDNFEIGFYLFSNLTSPYGYQWVGTHIRPRIAAPKSWKLPVGLSLSGEIGYQRAAYSADTWTVEIRPIIDKSFGDWYFCFNPVLGVSLKGVDNQHTPTFEPNIKVSWSASAKVAIGPEYYGNMGPYNHFDPGPAQNHAIFAVADLDLDPRYEVNFGAGWGLTRATDGLVWKLILGRRLGKKKYSPSPIKK